MRLAQPIVVCGKANQTKICTSHVEKQNHTLRMHCRRMSLLTNAFPHKAWRILKLQSRFIYELRRGTTPGGVTPLMMETFTVLDRSRWRREVTDGYLGSDAGFRTLTADTSARRDFSALIGPRAIASCVVCMRLQNAVYKRGIQREFDRPMISL